MNLTCDIVTDLMPLYKDGLASTDSAHAIRAHLRTCKSCRDNYRRCMLADMKRAVFIKNQPPAYPEAVLSERYQSLSKRLQKQHMLRFAATATIVAASIALAAASIYLKDEK